MYGHQWSRILNDSTYGLILCYRNNVNLKDKWRSLQEQMEKRKREADSKNATLVDQDQDDMDVGDDDWLDLDRDEDETHEDQPRAPTPDQADDTDEAIQRHNGTPVTSLVGTWRALVGATSVQS